MRKCLSFNNIFFVPALLIGGIIGVAGQFDYWECAAVSMYPIKLKAVGDKVFYSKDYIFWSYINILFY